jgi:hypothetical protein
MHGRESMRGAPRRGRARRRGFAAAALTAVAFAAATSSAAAAPVLTVTPKLNLDPSAPVALTVTGTGFNPAAGGGSGIYVTYGPKTAGGAAFSTSGSVLQSTKWTHLGATPSAGQETLNVDGSFSTTLTVSAHTANVDCTQVLCGVIAVAAHGDFTDRTQDTYVQTVFSPASPLTPAVTVTPMTGLDGDAETTLNVSGTGFDPNAAGGNGFYVAFGPRGSDFSTNTAPYYKAVYVRLSGTTPGTTLNLDGSWSTTIAVKRVYSKTSAGASPVTTDYDCSAVQCNVLTFGAQGSTDRSLDTTTPIGFAPAPGGGGSSSPTVAVSQSSGLSVESPTTLTVTGRNFSTVDPGIYVAFGPLVVTSDPGAYKPAKWVHVGATPSAGQDALSADGSFSTTLTVQALMTNSLSTNCTVTQCYVQTFKAHGASDPTQTTATPVSFGGVVASAGSGETTITPELVPDVAPASAPSSAGGSATAVPVRVAPKLTKVALGRKGRVSMRVSARSTVTFTVKRKVGRTWVVVKTIKVGAKKAGLVAADLRLRKHGLYRVSISAVTADGVKGRSVVKSVRVG